jgi:hypothetical protein
MNLSSSIDPDLKPADNRSGGIDPFSENPTAYSGAMEKRTHPRLTLDTYVIVDMDMYGRALNISEGGMCIIVPLPIDKGTMLHINFTLPGGRSLSMFGNVSWVKEYKGNKFQCGIYFLEFANDQKSIIRAYVNDHLHD